MFTKSFFSAEENHEENDEDFVPAFTMDQANQDEAQGTQGKNCNWL